MLHYSNSDVNIDLVFFWLKGYFRCVLLSNNHMSKEIKSTEKTDEKDYFEFDFDEIENTVSFLTVDDKLIKIKSPKTKQMLNCRKLIKQFGDEYIADDEDFMGRMVSLACVTEYADKTSMSFAEYEELSIIDSTKMAKALEFFRTEFNQVQHLLKPAN